ncbi:MAG: HAD family hydrolase [Phycisphaerae bacterium]|jgi:hypothetical protein
MTQTDGFATRGTSAPPIATRIAMWSGPRNISTALMRAWGNRPDTFVTDEPFYAHYLKQTGVEHPGADEVIAAHETDWRKVVAWLTGPVPEDRRIWYQKHMTHHMLPGVSRDWFGQMRHAFLIREPREMLASLLKKHPSATLPETGLPQQLEIFEHVRRQTGVTPPVIDAKDVLLDPRGVLSRLCAALAVEFDESMLSWPAGRRATDGVWAKYWYENVERSTGFEPYRERNGTLPPEAEALARECERLYRVLADVRLR